MTADTTVAAPRLTIAGQSRTGGWGLPVINPATGSPFTRVPTPSPAQLDEAVTAAAAAAVSWGAVPLPERQDRVRALVAVVRDHIDELARLLTLEQGKPLGRSAGEIRSGLSYVEAFAGMDLAPEVIRDDAGERIVVTRVPVGVVAAITPWNYPLMLALWKMGPALVAGNPVIVKPSPYTPVATLRLGELAQQVLPPGVVQVLAGDDGLGRAMAGHAGIAKISFTGSVATGRAYWHPVTLVRGAGEDAPLVAEEQFGPVLPLLTYDTVQEAVARANATQFGLGASVWSGDEERAIAIADSLQAGTVWVNQHPMLSPDTPFGGLKQSGIGVESSHHGLTAYTDLRVLRVRR